MPENWLLQWLMYKSLCMHHIKIILPDDDQRYDHREFLLGLGRC